MSEIRLVPLPVAGGYTLARETLDATGRPLSVTVGRRTYRTRREVEGMQALISFALVRAALSGGRQGADDGPKQVSP